MMHHNSHPTHHPHIHPPIHPSLQQQHPPQHLGQQMPHHMPPNINHHSAAAGSHHGFPRDQMNRLGHHPRINHHQIHPNHGRVPKQQQQGAQQHNNSMMMGQQQVKGQQQNQPHGGINSTAGGVTSGATQLPPQQQHHQQKKQQQQQQKQIQQMQVPQNQNSQSSQRLLQTIETKPNPTTTNTSPTGPNIPTVSAATATPPAPLQENKPKIEISGPDVDASTSKEKSQQSATSETLANIKEKTPMCLVNELARHNKIQHQYRLTCEQGPAHKKKFTVILKLGEEEYTAEGPSIKKAQHSAAAEAISATKYKHPPTKTNRTRGGAKGSENHVGNITPTVELNALAMKRGEQTVYVTEHPMKGAPINGIPPPAAQAFAQPQSGSNGASYMAPSHPLNPHATSYSGHPSFGGFQGRNAGPQNVYPPAMSRFHNFDKRSIPGRGFTARNPPPMATQFPPAGTFEPYRVTLTVGERQFVGVGNTQQAARHDAASRALEVLKPITSDSPNQDLSLTEDINAELKSPISLVHEMALKRNLTVGFEVKTEKGPPHMKIFVTICTVGTLKTEGEGNGKKISKKRAAEAMLEELKKLPPISPTQRIIKQKRKPQDAVKKKTRNLIKEKDDPEYHAEVNAISKLIQIQQSKKEKEPVYALAEERGAPRRREFVIEVMASGMTAVGVGSNKKLAKRLAAESLLALMGYGIGKEKGENGAESTSGASPSPEKGGKKVTYQERASEAASTGGSAGRQLVPGLLLMQQKDGGKGDKGRNTTVLNPHTTAAIAKEFLAGGTSPTADALTKGGGEQQTAAKTTINNNVTNEKTNETQSSVLTEGIRPKEQLLYLAQLIGFNAQFSDFPKGNHGEFLTLITLSTDPPQLCHGSGNSIEASHDQASTKMLTMLSELGLDNVHPVKTTQQPPSTPSVDETTKKPKSILTNGLKK
ncbi:double-stranded RNA-binding protein Staufen homolog 2 [Lutzomyia longipalpis]|uniref:double-stranded RNA-binding protein Staufen homolog 2 n=1 Tax=Lutzomyia longipalpis TaxID=7200 RepID=UPI0024844D4F|nr:double-stranded RNA-binding protein Staufen homolog 2 [Lutzomyia longipalpis]XP_055689693.1 double-stranded RNA-binding protein Staufen homolog 2 [Lutzomyia longipalpis]